MVEQVFHNRAFIGPPAGTEPRPLWSVMIPTYNCASFLREALASVLAQDLGPELMQIEVIDDHSTRDDPRATVNEMGRCRVEFFRQEQNQGVTGNLNTCLRRARGRLVHILHGDDGVRDGFYYRMQGAFEEYPEIGAAFCRQIFIDDSGHWLSISPLEQLERGLLNDCLLRLAVEQRIMTPSIVVRRDVYERLGGFDRRLICAEDWEMWVRIAADYPIAYETAPLALYRMHNDSNTGRHMRTAEDMRYTRKAINIFEGYLPPAVSRAVAARARETYALAALRTAETMLRGEDITAAMAQIGEALTLRRSPRVIRRTLRLMAQSLPRTVAGMLHHRRSSPSTRK